MVRTLCFHCQGPGFNPWLIQPSKWHSPPKPKQTSEKGNSFLYLPKFACAFVLPLLFLPSEELGLPRWHSGKEFCCQCKRHKRHGFSPWVGKIRERRKWQPTPVFLPGKSHGQRSLEATVCGVTKSQTRLSMNTYLKNFFSISFG